ncbi:MAG TPA: hypothetical protein VEK57_03915 [Thermoanaerobaculia bacterium]|nr:hypothetical protein [Thermoanaerobaculia bacterium]
MTATKRLLPLLFVLLCAVSSFGEYVERFEFDPASPVEGETFEVLVNGWWPSGGPPFAPQVVVDGHRIEIRFQAAKNGPPVISYWGARVSVGPLDAGTYVIAVRAAGDVLQEKTLVIEPRPFTVIPGFGPSGSEVLLRGVQVPAECRLGECLQVKFGGVPGEAARFFDRSGDILIRTPDHADGLVDVSLSTPIGDSVVAPKAFRFGRALGAGDYERVLFPVTFEGPGAHGSDWTTNIIVRNDSPLTVETAPLFWLNPDSTTSGPPILGPFPPAGRARFRELGSQAGRFLYIPRGLESFFSYSSHILDQSRAGTNLGTEIPVVHVGDTSNRIRLVNVPLDPAFRARLRIYEWDSQPRFVTVTVINVLEDEQHIIRLRLDAAVITCPTTPCLQPEPGYAALDFSTIPALAGAALGDVIIESETGDARLWAFVSVTNNETQHVTLYTPQHKNP